MEQVESGEVAELRFCPNCGVGLMPGQRFCAGCGQRLFPDVQPQRPAWSLPPRPSAVGYGPPPSHPLLGAVPRRAGRARDLLLSGGFGLGAFGGLLWFVSQLLAFIAFARVPSLLHPTAEGSYVSVGPYPLLTSGEGVGAAAWLLGFSALLGLTLAFRRVPGRQRLGMLAAGVGLGAGFLFLRGCAALLITVFTGIARFTLHGGLEILASAGFPPAWIATYAQVTAGCLVLAFGALIAMDHLLRRVAADPEGGDAGALGRTALLASLGFLLLMGSGVSELVRSSEQETQLILTMAGWGVLSFCCFAVCIAFYLAQRLTPEAPRPSGPPALLRQERILAIGFAVAVMSLVFLTAAEFHEAASGQWGIVEGLMKPAFVVRAVGMLFLLFGACAVGFGFARGWWEQRPKPFGAG
jgi:hypothetical protein